MPSECRVSGPVVDVKRLRIPAFGELDHLVAVDRECRTVYHFARLYVLEVHHLAVDFLVGAGPSFRLRDNVVTRRPERMPGASENARAATFAGLLVRGRERPLFEGVPWRDRVNRSSAVEVLLSHDARHI